MSVLSQLELDTAAEKTRLVAFIRDYCHGAGFDRALLGLSGGIDSALVCYLAVEALGAANVMALLMPYRTSSPTSEGDARVVINDLGIPWRKLAITPMVDAFVATDPEMSAGRQGNIMSRCRMVLLYDQSMAFDGLVLGTSNKTEMLLGYFTLYGDSAAALRPIAHLYKCQVRQLARAIGVPEAIITKAPSADLWANQTDEGELGFSYDDADQILHLYVDRGHDAAAIAAAGFDPRLVASVLRRMQATAFKRTSPPMPQ